MGIWSKILMWFMKNNEMALSVNMVMAFDTCYSYSSWITYFLLFPVLNKSGTNFFTRQSLLHMQDRLGRPAKGGILMLWVLWPVFMLKEPERSQNHLGRKMQKSQCIYYCCELTYCYSATKFQTSFFFRGHILLTPSLDHLLWFAVQMTESFTCYRQDCSPYTRRHIQRGIPSPTTPPYLPAHADKETDSDSLTLIKLTGPIPVCLPSLSNALQSGLYQLPSLPATWEGKSSRVRRNLHPRGGYYLSLLHKESADYGSPGPDFLVLTPNFLMLH